MTLEILTADTLNGVRHGFFTRVGGASTGLFAGLNCGQHSGDDPALVAENRTQVANQMGVEVDALLFVHQVHSADVIEVRETWTERPKADAMVSRTPGIALGVLTADCAPVLFSDPEAGVVGAAHAGWKGSLEGVIEATVDAMVSLGAERGRIRAAIGPTISQRAYEVGPDFLDEFMDADTGHSRFFANGDGDRYLFNLPGFVLDRLRAAGVEDAEWIGHCTYTDAGRFYSYRRTTHRQEPDYGRLISVVGL